MKFPTIQQVLTAKNNQISIGSEPLNHAGFTEGIINKYFDGKAILIIPSQPPESDDKSKITIRGKSAFPLLHLDTSANLPDVLAIFELKDIAANGEGTLSVTLKYTLPKSWQFSQSFPNLPFIFDLGVGLDGERRSLLNYLKLLETNDHLNLDACFILTTEPHQDQQYHVTVEPGLNFVGRWDAAGMLGVLENLLPHGSNQLILFGPIVLSSNSPQPALTAGQSPWDVQPTAPGIHLQAQLGTTPQFGKTIQFGEVLCKLYSPITGDWLMENPTYQPALAYLCDSSIPSAHLGAGLVAKKQLGEDSLLVGARFQGASVTNLVALTELAGGEFASGLPSPVVKYLSSTSLGDLQLEYAAAMLVPSGTSYSVAYSYFSLGLPNFNWTIFQDVLKIDSIWTEIIVFSPFTPEQRSIAGTMIGVAEVLGLKLQVIVELPDTFISAKQLEDKTIPLKAFFHKYLPGVPPPSSDLVIERLMIVAKPGAYYTFSLAIAGSPQWEINVGSQAIVLENIAFSLSKDINVSGSIAALIKLEKLTEPTSPGGEKQDLDIYVYAALSTAAGASWQFEGSTGQGQTIPIGNLIQWIKDRFDTTPLPTSIARCTIQNLKIAFNTQSKDFTFICQGTVPLPDMDTAIAGTVIIDIKHQQDGSFTKQFGGTLVIDALEFALIFEAASKADKATSKTFVAAYHDPKGRAIAIDPLINKIFQTTATTGLTLAVKDALFAYQSQTNAPTSPDSTPTEATPQSVSTSNYLLGIDIEAGLNLSTLKLPDLPLIGAAFSPDQNLKLALQVFYAHGEFSTTAVSNLNSLNSQGLRLPPQDIKAGLSLTALLRVGQDVKPLSLPIGFGGDGLVNAAPSSSTTATSTSSSPPTETANSTQSSANVTAADSTQWLKIQKTFGPIHVERVGVGYQESKIQCVLDADLTAAGLTLSLDGLGAEFALSDLTAKTFNPTFHLDGIGIDYRNGPLEIGGAFLKHTVTPAQKPGEPAPTPYTSYAGLAVIRTEKLTLSAIGSYAAPNGRDPSLFIYAVLNYPLGGPSFFFITGFAAGFGYNRALAIPSIDDIATFPLVAEATRGDAPALPQSGSPTALADTITTELQKLENYISPSVGDIFIAAGIKFTTFKQVTSFALLIVKFGQRFEIDLLGLSTLVAPPSEVGGEPVAEAQLALKATFIPDEGLLSIQAQLTPNSYILSRACHLTGGFAFFSWFKDHPSGAKAGDFVITLGGYHPKFDVPKHYPIVPRLGINWQVNKPTDPYELLIKGQAYFALTAPAIMVGGHLEATWSSGALRAWFKAGADFLITWQPYHYDASFYVDIGASYTFELFGTHTITVELGADLHIWGPEFAGSATLHLWIISFTVNFGSGSPQRLIPITWANFKTSFLPEATQIVSINVQAGLIRQIKPENNQPACWNVNPKEFVFATNSVVPSNEAYLANKSDPTAKPTKLSIGTTQTELAVAPVGIESSVTSKQIITIAYEGIDVSALFEFVPILKAVPAGLWGKPNLTADKQFLNPPSLNGERLLENTLAGFEIKPAKPVKDPDHSAWIASDALQYATELIPNAYDWQDFQLVDLQGKAAWEAANQTTVANSARDELLQALGWGSSEIDFGQPIDQGTLVTA